MPPLRSLLFAGYRRMSWGQRGYVVIVLAAAVVFGTGAVNHWRVRNYERLSQRISAAGARATRSINLVANEEDAYFLGLLGDFSSVAITGLIGDGRNCTVDAALLRELRNYPEVTRLRLPLAPLKQEEIQCIYELENLRTLNLAFSPITDADLDGVEKLQNLESLELQFTPLTDVAIPHLAKLTGLVTLDISGTDITPAGVERLRWEYRLAQGTQNPTTVIYRPAPSLRFREAVIHLLPTRAYGIDNRFPNGPVRLMLRPEIWKGHEQDIPWVAELSDVEVATIQSMPISQEMLDAVTKLPMLRQLNISDVPAAEVDFTQLAKCRKLRTLRIVGMPLDEKFVASLAKVESLETLHITNCPVTPGACLAFANLRSVQSLHLRQLQVDKDAFARLLVELRQSPRLRLLELAWVPIDNQSLASLSHLTQLVSLGLATHEIDDDAIPSLCTFTHLQQLDISGTKIDLPDGAAQLEAALLPAKVRVVHPKSMTLTSPLSLAELTAKVAEESAAAAKSATAGTTAGAASEAERTPRK